MIISKTNAPPHEHQRGYSTPTPCHRNQNHVVLPFYHPNNPNQRRIIICISLVLLAALVYALWPSDPALKIVRLRLNRFHVHTFPVVKIDIYLKLIVEVRNVDVFSMDYKSLDVALRYRGRRLGHVKSEKGHVRALASSYVDAELELKGVRILSDVVPLLEDLARGTVPLDTVYRVSGKLWFLFFGFPLKAKMSCEVSVNTSNQTIVRQNCYPETHSIRRP